MVKIEVDTNNDSVAELKDALRLIEQAIARRGGIAVEPVGDEASSAQDLLEETAIDTPFFKISVGGSESDSGGPTVNELLENESITEDELTDLFSSTGEVPTRKRSDPDDDDSDGYIEIVELDDDDIR